MKRPQIILIGGSSGVGTTSLSVEVSNVMDISHIVETDYIREVLRGIISKEYAPVLHTSSYSSYDKLSGYGELSKFLEFKDLVSLGFMEHVGMVTPTIERVIRRSIKEMNNTIFEGIHISPALISLHKFKRWADAHLFIISVDEDEHQERFIRRSIERKRGGTHLDYFKEIRITHELLVKQAQEHNYPVIDNTGDLKSTVDEIVKHIKQDV